MPFWKRTKKIISTFKRQGSDRIKIPSTQQISRSQSDYAIDSLKLYDKQYGISANGDGRNDRGGAKPRPLSLFLENEERGDAYSLCDSGSNSIIYNLNHLHFTDSSEVHNDQSGRRLSQDRPQSQCISSSAESNYTQWTDFSLSDLHNFLDILTNEEEEQRQNIIRRYQDITKQIHKRLQVCMNAL